MTTKRVSYPSIFGFASFQLIRFGFINMTANWLAWFNSEK